MSTSRAARLELRELAPNPLEFLSRASLDFPECPDENSAWVEHIPFAFWMIAELKPSCLVELGTQGGASYLAFCQAVQTLGVGTRCFAVDSWKGDEQAGSYGEEVFQKLSEYHNDHYKQFSRLVRTSFDDAVNHFDDGSIDLLHIDGLHTYEAVEHDFETWKPKLSSRAVVLFHDTNVRERDFGVFTFWQKVADRYPHFEFLHGHGLGVLGIGKDLPAPAQRLFRASEDDSIAAKIREIYARLGSHMSAQILLRKLHSESEKLSVELSNRNAEAARLRDQNRTFRQSFSWRITKPIRAAAKLSSWPARLLRSRKRTKKCSPLRQEFRLISGSGLFDEGWHLKRYPEVAEVGIDPLIHYLQHGAAENRSPGPLFDAKRYLNENPDVAQSGLNPLIHYLRYGAAEGRNSYPVPGPTDETKSLAVGPYRPERKRLTPTAAEQRVLDAFHKLYYGCWQKDDSISPDTINLHWFGHQTLKCPLDLWTYQELIVEQRPDWIIEAGTHLGGSAYFMAGIMDLLGHGRVLTIDIADLPDRPQHPRIDYRLGSSIAPETVAFARQLIGPNSNCMVILDSHHGRDHVYREMCLYQEFVPIGGYLIVEDTNINGNPAREDYGPGPMEAVEAFLGETNKFEVDTGRERFLMTLNPRGYLRRIR